MTSRRLEWTVVSWNVRGSRRTDLAAVARFLRVQAPDVVALQEVRRPQADSLAAMLDMAHTWAFKHNPFQPFLHRRAEGAAIMTPHGLSAVDHAVVSDATSTRSYRRRIAQWALVRRPDASAYRVLNVHLSPHDDAAAARQREAERIAAVARDLGDAPPTVVAGDLNDDGEPAVIATLPGVEHLAPPASNPAGRPTRHLDHVLLPADATGVSVSVPAGGASWAALSDHLPVTVRFSLDWVHGDFAG